MKSKERIIVTFVALLLFALTSVGYALYNARIGASGNAKFSKNGKVAITSATIYSYQNLNNPANPTYTDDSINFDLSFTVARNNAAFEKEYSATYEITITNASFYDYSFSSSTFNPSATTENNTKMVVTYGLDGIEIGDTIPSGESKTFYLTINMYPQDSGTFNVSGSTEVGLEEKADEGSLLASIPKGTTGDLSNGNSYFKVTATVINSYKSNKQFTFSISNSNFYLVDENGSMLTPYTIDANTTNTYDFYIKVQDGAKFPTDRQSMNIYFEPTEGSKSSMGVVTIKVDVDSTLTDDEPPTITDVTATFLSDKGNILVEYSGSDNVGIDHYVIETYKVSDDDSETLILTNNTVADEESYTVTGLEDGTYYFKVKAIDLTGLSSTASSTKTSYRWTMVIYDSLTNATVNGEETVNYGNSYSATISGNGNYNAPASLTIVDTKDNELVAGADYTYDSSTGALYIQSVTDDLTIKGSGRSNGCLVEGTKILLANGTYKNIEDINYDDLLMVWSYDTGRLTKEYPLWIENEHTSNKYTEITFSDNSIIKVVKSHSFFSTDLNMFVNFNDKENFHIGTNVAKVAKKGDLKTVSVTSIKEIEENITYYYVASTRYYNIISEDFITTDGYTDITNLYKFNNDISWDKNRMVKTMRYSYLKDTLPYYMYKGFRAGEFAVLMQNGSSSLEQFKNYIKTLVINPEMLKKPIMKNNKRYWMVTTGYDKVVDKEKYLVKEETYYTLPKVDGVKYWYSTSENKKYKPRKKVKVWTGMHFEAIK